MSHVMAGEDDGEEEEEGEEKMTTLRDYVRLLRDNAVYRILFIAYCIDNCGIWMTFVACLTIIEQVGGGGALDTSVFLICRFLPSILFAGFFGPIADRYNKFTLLIICSLGSAFTVLLLVGLLSVSVAYGKGITLILIYTLTLMQFTFSALYEPVRSSLLPLVVSKCDLIVATSLDGLAWSAVGAFGAALGGLVNSLFGSNIAFGLDVVSYLLCAYMLYRIPRETLRKSKQVGGTGNEEKGQAKLIDIDGNRYSEEDKVRSHEKNQDKVETDRDVTDGSADFMTAVLYLFQNKFILLLCLIKGGGAIVWGVAAVIGVKVSQMDQFQTLGDESVTMGLIFACEGLGYQLGPLLWNNCTPQKERSLLFAVVVAFVQMAFSYVLMVYAPGGIWGILGSTVLRSMGAAVIWIYSTLLLQRAVWGALQGRVFAIEQAMSVLCEMGSIVMGGLFFDLLGWGVEEACRAMGLVGGCVCVCWVIVYCARYHSGWQWASGEGGEEGREGGGGEYFLLTGVGDI